MSANVTSEQKIYIERATSVHDYKCSDTSYFNEVVAVGKISEVATITSVECWRVVDFSDFAKSLILMITEVNKSRAY